MKKARTWLLLVFLLGTGVGFFHGAGLGYRWATKNMREQQINDGMIALTLSLSTISKIESDARDRVISDHSGVLYSAFLTLVDIHKSGEFDPAKEERLLRLLKQARTFMEERPTQFIGNTVAPFPTVDELNNPGTSNDEAIEEATEQYRDLLQDAFDYVDRLPI